MGSKYPFHKHVRIYIRLKAMKTYILLSLWSMKEAHDPVVKPHLTAWFGLWRFNATFNNISFISWRSVLLVEETGVPGENDRPVTSN
jgi:hypothetical protein